MSTLLSQGGFGCIYLPGINCDGTTHIDNKFVTKIQINNFNSQNEKKIGTLAKKINNFELYFFTSNKKLSYRFSIIRSFSIK